MIVKKLTVLMACVLMCSCWVSTHKVVEYDPDCHTKTKKFVLTVEQVKMFENMHCQNDECKAEFVNRVVGTAVLLPVSAIVSGSIAVVGNTLYWVQEKEKCS